MSLRPSRPGLWDYIGDILRRLRILEAVTPPASCPQWEELTPALTLAGGGVLTQPDFTSSQLDLICTTGLGSPGTFYEQGELTVSIDTDPGSGSANTHYLINWSTSIGTGGASEIVGYGRCYQPGGTISYPALLTAGGRVQIEGVNDTGGGGTPTFARPDFPFVFAAGDVVFEGHYLCWGDPSL